MELPPHIPQDQPIFKVAAVKPNSGKTCRKGSATSALLLSRRLEEAMATRNLDDR
jgi:hypothetical protein